MIPSNHGRQALVLFRIDVQRYALRLDAVERIIHAVAVTPAPEAPAFVLGLINLAGQLMPVVSGRRRLGLPDRPVRPDDQFVIARTPRMTLALAVDEVQGLSADDAGRTLPPDAVLPEMSHRVSGLVTIEGDIVFVYDLESLLSQEAYDGLLRARAAAETSSHVLAIPNGGKR